MIKHLVLFLFIAVLFVSNSQNSIVKIEGFAPTYVGKQVQIYEIEDYLSMKEATIATTTVENDSIFKVSFSCTETKKIIIKIGNNRSFMYIQPDGNYSILFPEKDKYTPYRPAGNQVEVTFFDLDSTDINYKILGFNRWLDNYLALNYKLHLTNPVEFIKRMDDFKEAATKYYIADTGKFIFDYVRFTIANVDNIQQAGNRNRYEKHDFYLKYQPVRYQNDAYMEYFKNFYRGMMPTIPMEVNNRVYLGLLKSSPTLIMNALGLEYTLVNMRIREMVMIQMLSELYYQPDYPQTNIITVLDSVQHHALFSANKIIATNMLYRLTEATNGGKSPDLFVKSIAGQTKSLIDYKGKYLYVHFFDPNSEKSRIELPILKDLYKKYNKNVNFLTICKESSRNEKSEKVIEAIDWDVAFVDDNSSICSSFKVATFPLYTLIDPHAYIVQCPALSPLPNSLYETIDKVFFEIQKAMSPSTNGR